MLGDSRTWFQVLTLLFHLEKVATKGKSKARWVGTTKSLTALNTFKQRGFGPSNACPQAGAGAEKLRGIGERNRVFCGVAERRNGKAMS